MGLRGQSQPQVHTLDGTLLISSSHRAAILLVLLPVSSHTNLSVAEKINQGGFIAITVVQSVVVRG